MPRQHGDVLEPLNGLGAWIEIAQDVVRIMIQMEQRATANLAAEDSARSDRGLEQVQSGRRAITRAQRQPREPFTLGDSLQSWFETARDVLVDLMQIDQEIAARLAREMVVRYAEDHPGETIYFAKGVAYQLDTRDQVIFAEFNGRNQSELARKYRVTPRHMYRLIKRARAVDTWLRQADMFPDPKLIPDRH